MSLDSWTFYNPVAIRFGSGCLVGQGAALPKGKALIVTTGGAVRRGTVERLLHDFGAPAEYEIEEGVTPNPEVGDLEQMRNRYYGEPISYIVALGGGSVMDSSKVLSVLLRCPRDFDLRGQLKGLIPMPDVIPVPVYAIPTTAGTGAEVTPFATVWSAKEGKKFSFASPCLYPVAAWLDPRLTHSLSEDVTISTGLDALSQALESIWNRNANAYTRMLGGHAARLSFGALSQLSPFDPSTTHRQHLMEASLFAGLAISQTRTALCHSMSYPITARFGLAHGYACSFMLPAVLRFNGEEDDRHLSITAKELGFHGISEFASRLATLLRDLKVADRVRRHVPNYDSLFNLADEMITPGRTDNNLRAVSERNVQSILRAAGQDLELL